MPPTTATTEPAEELEEGATDSTLESDTPSDNDAETAPANADGLEVGADDPEQTIEALRSEVAMLRKHDDDMRALATEAGEYLVEHEHHKGLASAAKKRYETTVEKMRELAESRPSFGPLFDGSTDEDTPGNPPPKCSDPNAWRDTPIEALVEHGATAGDIEKLEEADILTLGRYADYVADKTGRGVLWHVDLKGVGEKAADRIETASLNWHAANPQGKAEDAPTLTWEPCDSSDADEAFEAFSEITDDGSPFSYIVARQDAKWYVSDSDAELLPGEDADGLTFDSAEQAQAWCEGRELTLRAEAEHEDPRDRLLTGLISEPVVVALAAYLDTKSTDSDVAADMLTVGHLLDAFDTELEAVEALAEHGAMNAQVTQAWARIRAFNVNGE